MSGKLPPCSHGTECFANDDKRCTVLKDTCFRGKKCPFFKTKEQLQKEQEGSKTL